MSCAARSPTSRITRRRANFTERYLLQRRATIVAVEAAEELHQLDDQLGARVDRRRLEQRLLGGGIERRDLPDAVDERRVINLADPIPLDAHALPPRQEFGPPHQRPARRHRAPRIPSPSLS